MTLRQARKVMNNRWREYPRNRYPRRTIAAAERRYNYPGRDREPRDE